MSHHSLLLPDPSEQVCLRHLSTACQGLLFRRHFISASLPRDEPGICLVFPALLGPAQSRCLVKTSKHWNHDRSNPRDREQWPEREKEKEWLWKWQILSISFNTFYLGLDNMDVYLTYSTGLNPPQSIVSEFLPCDAPSAAQRHGAYIRGTRWILS